MTFWKRNVEPTFKITVQSDIPFKAFPELTLCLWNGNENLIFRAKKFV